MYTKQLYINNIIQDVFVQVAIYLTNFYFEKVKVILVSRDIHGCKLPVLCWLLYDVTLLLISARAENSAKWKLILTDDENDAKWSVIINGFGIHYLLNLCVCVRERARA